VPASLLRAAHRSLGVGAVLLALAGLWELYHWIWTTAGWTWLNEINKLIWPSASGIGIMNTADYQRTAQISQQFGVITKAPSGAYRTDLATKAVAELKAQGLDVNGKSWKPLNVKVSPGGK
jgi:NitT/TauT family transport system substrate-binding protein